ncbi:MAG TPA: hypothetical protein VJO52_05930 [Gemmatimonadaceae bacterium]|nr:hypothetical protein [Gemmatimonadaceae bacterium]
MNAPSPAARQPSLFGVLAARARHATDTRLVADATMGTTLAAAILVIRPALWVLAMPAVVVAAYGAWGITDREVSAHAPGTPRVALGVARAAALVAGLIAALGFLFGALGALLGNWIL